MGPLSFKQLVKSFISNIGWRLFLWGSDLTEEQYINQLYEEESLIRTNIENTVMVDCTSDN